MPVRQMLLSIQQLCTLNYSIHFGKCITGQRVCTCHCSHITVLCTPAIHSAHALGLCGFREPGLLLAPPLQFYPPKHPMASKKAGEQIKPHLAQPNQALLLLNWDMRGESPGSRTRSDAHKAQQLQEYIQDNGQTGCNISSQ